MTINNNDILHNLQKIRVKNSMSLSQDEKTKMFSSILASELLSVASLVSSKKILSTRTIWQGNTISRVFTFARYALPIFVLGFVGLTYGDQILLKGQLAYTDFIHVKTELALTQTSAQLRESLSKTTRDIYNLKSLSVYPEKNSEKEVLVSEVSSGSKSIRNQVAALVKENKITEAKQIVLTLETALKADELYKVAPAVQAEVTAATDLRVKLEKKETLATVEASTTAHTNDTMVNRIKQSRDTLIELENLAKTDTDATTTKDLFVDAKRYLEKADTYMKGQETENTIISLQTYDRIVAEIKLFLIK